MNKNALVLLFCFSLSAVFSQAIIRTDILSNPSGATVYVDGSQVGRTPLEFRFRDGKMYKIELRRDNYHSASFNYRGGSGTINKRLEQIAPPRRPNEMSSPSYEENRRPHEKHNNSKNDFYNDKHHKTPPKSKYTLSVTSDISSAKVIVDRKFAGRTPLKIELERGKHDVLVNLPGRRDYHEQINLDCDKDIFIRFR